MSCRAEVARTMAAPTSRNPHPLHDKAPAPLTGVHILVVDDDRDMRRLLTLVLSAAGAIVIAVASAQAAIDVVKQSAPQLIVSDLQLPHVDGLGLIRSVRALSKDSGGATPAILLTGDSSGATRRHASSAGFNAFMCKPVEARDLIRTAGALLSAG